MPSSRPSGTPRTARKQLEDAGSKLSAVATDITGVSGRARLETLVAGERDPGALAERVRKAWWSLNRPVSASAPRVAQLRSVPR